MTILNNPIKRVAKRLNVSVQTVYNEINAGRLITFRIGKRRFVSEDALHKYIRDREAEAS